MKDTKMLARLETLIDIVFALSLWEIFSFLPSPSLEGFELMSIADLVADESSKFVIAFIAILIISIYWIQNNNLFKYLHHTNAIHSLLSIFNLFLLLLFLHAVDLSIHLDGDKNALLIQSISAFVYGTSTYITWWYALKAELVDRSLSLEDAQVLSQRNFAEPVTAIFTLPFAFGMPILWNLSWFAYPFIRKIFRGKLRKFTDKETLKYMTNTPKV